MLTLTIVETTLRIHQEEKDEKQRNN